MSGPEWLTILAILVAGLVLGAFLATRLRRQDPQSGTPAEAANLALRISDLAVQRDALYRHLGDADEEALEPSERLRLEEAAAKTLLELDRARGELERLRPGASKEARESDQVAHQARGRNPALAGFAYGSALAGVVAVLVWFALRDSGSSTGTMGPSTPPAQQSMAGDQTTPPHQDLSNLPPEAAEQVRTLAARIEENPQDLMARKELALLFLSTDQLFPAFQEAQAIVEISPEDPDALYVQGVVRLAMGQTDQAQVLFERVVARFPEHIHAHLFRGMSLLRSGDLDRAVEAWETGLEAAGGTHPQLEELLRRAKSGMSAEEILGPPI